MKDEERAVKAWYVVGRDRDGGQLAYIIEGDTSQEARLNFALEFPDLEFINIF
ncbi:hypothetical protein FHT44_005199 [Mycolicibacterium sp. BK634]|uniref:hypothetical protein n=1 Tax=Mycolicibacterium sp. BK634 TaxID=2587099 RepID=UPI001612C908|nr:hypothetical protein [Mycolicibacterium sp. BK634]MBB3752687.1 hypothetical protein [Mycolicibacterium sp. BK634]